MSFIAGLYRRIFAGDIQKFTRFSHVIAPLTPVLRLSILGRSGRRWIGLQRLVDAFSQLLYQLVNLRSRDDERRGQQDVVAGLAVNRAGHRITDQTILERMFLDLGGNPA